jgi:hypothetical protein
MANKVQRGIDDSKRKREFKQRQKQRFDKKVKEKR